MHSVHVPLLAQLVTAHRIVADVERVEVVLVGDKDVLDVLAIVVLVVPKVVIPVTGRVVGDMQ